MIINPVRYPRYRLLSFFEGVLFGTTLWVVYDVLLLLGFLAALVIGKTKVAGLLWDVIYSMDGDSNAYRANIFWFTALMWTASTGVVLTVILMQVLRARTA